MFKSTKTSLKFSNREKHEQIKTFIAEYRRVTELFIDVLWELETIPKFITKELSEGIDTWLSARTIQCIGKQASGIVRGTRKKQEKRIFIYNKLIKNDELKKARRLKMIIDKVKITKPEINSLEPELDSRFIKIDLDNNTSFDGWLTISSIGNKQKIVIPFKKTKHFNRISHNSIMTSGVRLSNKNITFMFESNTPTKKETGITIGLDIGQTTILSCSNGVQVEVDAHGHSYKSICDTLSRKKKGSKGFLKAQNHRTNFIGWSINQLDLQDIKQVNRENIKYMRYGKRSSKSLTHWNYKELLDKLDSKLVDSGVQINKIDPTYTSQRCSKCGWVRKGNRKGKAFKCDRCGFAADADLNASLNLSFELVPIGKQQRLKKSNIQGFYWLSEEQAPIVPVALKTENKIC